MDKIKIKHRSILPVPGTIGNMPHALFVLHNQNVCHAKPACIIMSSELYYGCYLPITAGKEVFA